MVKNHLVAGETILARKTPAILPDVNFEESVNPIKTFQKSFFSKDFTKLVELFPCRFPASF
jgi:hypothetical protein